jgi:phosphate transport system substrate-binding protein
MLPSLKETRRVAYLPALVLTVGLAACGPQTATPPSTTTGASPAANSAGGKTVSLSGAGATFPAPLYQRWFSEYNKLNPSVQISYQSVGSGAGVKQFLAQTVDFGASDAPLKDDERKEFPADRGQPLQLPMTGGGLVFAYNLDGVDNLKLSREAYCGIVEGAIKTWNDPKIAKDNAGVNLPNAPVTFVHRSDGSGTTSIFTTHIDAACPNWKAGAGKSVEWPTGTGAKGNEGVTATIQQTKNTIGYTEFSYARENGLKMAVIQNKAGEFVTPTPEAFSASLLGEPVPANFALVVPDPAGKDAYPIVGLTWLLLYGNYPDQAKAEALKGAIKWALSEEGDKFAKELGYLPLPEDVTSRVLATLDTIKIASK